MKTSKPKAVREVNPCAKTRNVENPYEIYKGPDFECRVLKKYQSPSNEANNPLARWFCATKTSATFGTWEYGDGYATDIMARGSKQAEEQTIVNRIEPR